MPAAATITITTMTTTDAALRLLAWLSPAFPVGAFAYSHGLEWAIEAGDVRDEATLGDWLADVLAHGAGRNDAILLRHAWRARQDELASLCELAAALAPCRERREETLAQGAAFVRAARIWGGARLLALPDAPAYPIAVGALAADHGINENLAAAAYLQAMTSNLISAGVRLIPLGQTAGLRVLARLASSFTGTAAETAGATLDDIGGACFRADIASMRHETQETRLFRT